MAGKAVDARALDLGALAAGTVFDGRYTIVECIGRGGMGAVYQAVDRETRQTVALKTLPSNDPRLFEALSREVALAAQLQHPNLLGVRHLETRGDAPYVVMELLDDGDLDAALRARGGKMGAEEALRVLDGVLAGLAALHAAGVVHLDLKPANVLLGKDGRVKLADFGISSRTRDQKTGSSGAATPEYASPEQVRGAPCDTRADVYAAGMLAHVLLAGRFPFEARDVNGVRAWHERGDRRFPAVLPAVGEVLTRALAVKPDDRYRTAEELQRALKGALVRKSWYALADGASEALKGRLAARVRVTGTTGTLSDAEGMLRRGAARPGWRTEAGAVVLEAHALAARHVGASVKLGGALEAGGQALAGKGDALRDLAEQPAEVEAALALAAWLGGNEGLALRRLDVAQRRADTVGAHLAVAMALRAGLGDGSEVREAVQRAEGAAEKTTDDAVVGWLDVAAFHRWVLGDRKGLTRAMLAAERASSDDGDHLAVAQAHLASGSETAEVDAAVVRFLAARGVDVSTVGSGKGVKRDGATEAATLGKRADALVDAARALGPLACVRAAAEALQRAAGTDPDALDAARRTWDALGEAESAARTAEARTASLDAQCAKLLERLARLELPAERPAGALSPAVLAKLAEHVEAQEAFARAARDLDARAVLLPPLAWARPFTKAEVSARGEFLGVQERLQQRVVDLDARAAAVHLPACAWVRPLAEAAVEARAREVVAQEARANASAALDAERAGLGLAAWAWTRPVAEDEVTACRADTQPWAERAAEVRALAERCRARTGWAPDMGVGPYTRGLATVLKAKVEAQEAGWYVLASLGYDCCVETEWAPEVPRAEFTREVEERYAEEVRTHRALHARVVAARAAWKELTGAEAEALGAPYTEERVGALERGVEEQRRFAAELDELAGRPRQAPNRPAGPWSPASVKAYATVVERQIERERRERVMMFAIAGTLLLTTGSWACVKGQAYRQERAHAEAVAQAEAERQAEEAARVAAEAARKVAVWTSPTLGAMQWVPAATFVMGSPDMQADRSSGETRHQVTLTKGFWLMEHEVTQGEWQTVMGSNPAQFSACGAACPVEKVSWEDAQAFVQKVSVLDGVTYALPTEAQWEYAARGGQAFDYAGSDTETDVAWVSENAGHTTHPVCQKQRNGFGLCDMSGNVWEWTADIYGDYPNGAVIDPVGAASGFYRVRRGGSWSVDWEHPDVARVALRSYSDPALRSFNLGFRLSRTVP